MTLIYTIMCTSDVTPKIKVFKNHENLCEGLKPHATPPAFSGSVGYFPYPCPTFPKPMPKSPKPLPHLQHTPCQPCKTQQPQHFQPSQHYNTPETRTTPTTHPHQIPQPLYTPTTQPPHTRQVLSTSTLATPTIYITP